jgi:hypothetical protein
MKKTLNVEEATEMDLQFNDGTTLALAFNVRALSFINDKSIGGATGFFKCKSVPEYCAKIVYLTAKAAGNEITIEKARELTCNMKPVSINEIVKEFQESNGVDTSEEAQKKILMELLKETVN